MPRSDSQTGTWSKIACRTRVGGAQRRLRLPCGGGVDHLCDEVHGEVVRIPRHGDRLVIQRMVPLRWK